MRRLVLVSLLVFTGCIDIITPEPSTVQSSHGKVSAVVVGVENGYAGKCTGSLYDADRMARTLKNYVTTNSLVLLKDKSATFQAVSKALADAVAVSELTIFYYSGHGGSVKAPAGSDETDGYDEYVCLYDKGWLDDGIWNTISQTTNRIFLVFDCCHSQTMFRSPMLSSVRPALCGAKSGQVRMLCWSGCPDDTYSYGSDDGGELTNAILRHFDAGKTYEQIWDAVKADPTLKRFQDSQKTVIGIDFQSEKIFK